MGGSDSAEQFDYLIQAQVRQSDLIEYKQLQESLRQAACNQKDSLNKRTVINNSTMV